MPLHILLWPLRINPQKVRIVYIFKRWIFHKHPMLLFKSCYKVKLYCLNNQYLLFKFKLLRGFSNFCISQLNILINVPSEYWINTIPLNLRDQNNHVVWLFLLGRKQDLEVTGLLQITPTGQQLINAGSGSDDENKNNFKYLSE